MADPRAGKVWLMRVSYVGIALVVVFFHLLPFEMEPSRLVAPDLLIAVTFSWALRRPDFLPALLVAGVMLLCDLLLQRPPGLWAALALMATEWLKRRDRRIRDNTFFEEWLTVAIVLAAITVIYRLVLALLIVSPGTLYLALIQYVGTVLIYPLVVAVSHVFLNVRHTAPGDFDPMGRSL